MKNFLIGLGILVVAVIVLLVAFGDRLVPVMMEAALKPKVSFDESTRSAALDYADDASWVALPQTEDNADYTPGDLTDNQAAAQVAVFYIHPTTYISKDAWNAPLDDEEANDYVANMVMPAQASVFNGCCQVYAPKYRQATLWSFMEETENSQQALALAYEDVERAFDAFLDRIEGRPFILAGHSQGGLHASNLLKNAISGSQLTFQMVAAYPVGFPLNPEDFAEAAPDIPVCSTPEQLGCFVTWNAKGPEADVWPQNIGEVCVNPLSWRTDGEAVAADQNPGSLSFGAEGEARRFEAGVSGAQCVKDRLLVGDFQSDMYDDMPPLLGKDNYHLIDYGLFYASIRENAITRTNAYLEKYPAPIFEVSPVAPEETAN